MIYLILNFDPIPVEHISLRFCLLFSSWGGQDDPKHVGGGKQAFIFIYQRNQVLLDSYFKQ